MSNPATTHSKATSIAAKSFAIADAAIQLLVLVGLLLLAGCATSPTAPPAVDAAAQGQWVPPLKTRVNDYTNILPNTEQQALEARLAAYEAETRHQIAVLTISSLKGEAIDDFSLRVANTWGIGQKGLDNGIQVTVAPTERLMTAGRAYAVTQ